jgi:hypothetical protein
MPILGLATTESDANWRFKNIRRQVFYFYPNGAAPLTGLLSLINDEDSDDPEFQWWEKRLDSQTTITAIMNALGPWGLNPAQTTAGETDDSSIADVAAAQTWLSGNIRRLKVASVASLRVGHVIMIRNVTMTAGTTNLTGVITSINITTKNINVRSTCNTTSTVTNVTGNNGLDVFVIGSSFTQGSAATTGGVQPASGQVLSMSSLYNVPLNAKGWTQTFRTPFELTGTALKTGLKFDDTGPYKDQAKEASVYHMIEMEKAFLFGQPSYELASTNSLPRYTTCGIIPMLEIWEAISTDPRIATLGFPTYRGAGQAAVTLDTDDNKRIIANAGGTINEKIYNGYLERVFRITNNTANEKLVLCGSGALSVLNQLYKDKSVLNSDIPMTDTYGMNITKHVCPFGTLYYKSHPLFSQNPFLRNCLLILDIQNIKYRYIQGRDTTLLKNRQNNGDDFRRDEWLTECGVEARFPESNMFIQNILSYTP